MEEHDEKYDVIDEKKEKSKEEWADITARRSLERLSKPFKAHLHAMPWYELKVLDKYDLQKIDEMPTATTRERLRKANAIRKYHKEALGLSKTRDLNAFSLRKKLREKLNEINETTQRPYYDMLLDSLMHLAIKKQDVSAMKLIFAYIDGLPALTLNHNNTTLSVTIAEAVASKYNMKKEAVLEAMGKEERRMTDEYTDASIGKNIGDLPTKGYPVEESIAEQFKNGDITAL